MSNRYQESEKLFLKKFKNADYENKSNITLSKNNLTDMYDIDFFCKINDLPKIYFDLEDRNINLNKIPNIHIPQLSVSSFYNIYTGKNHSLKDMKNKYNNNEIPYSKKLEYYHNCPKRSFHISWVENHKTLCIIPGVFISEDYSNLEWVYSEKFKTWWLYYTINKEYCDIININKNKLTFDIYYYLVKKVDKLNNNNIYFNTYSKLIKNVGIRSKINNEPKPKKIREPVKRTIK